MRELSAGTITLARMPVMKPVPSDPNAPLLPDIDVSVGRLAIERFVVEAAGHRQAPHSLGLNGSAEIADGRATIDADAAATIAHRAWRAATGWCSSWMPCRQRTG